MTESPTQRAERADRMLERCRDRGYVTLSHLESLRNDLRAVANEYDDLAAERAQAPHALMPESFGAWLDAELKQSAETAERALAELRATLRPEYGLRYPSNSTSEPDEQLGGASDEETARLLAAHGDTVMRRLRTDWEVVADDA